VKEIIQVDVSGSHAMVIVSLTLTLGQTPLKDGPNFMAAWLIVEVFCKHFCSTKFEKEWHEHIGTLSMFVFF